MKALTRDQLPPCPEAPDHDWIRTRTQTGACWGKDPGTERYSEEHQCAHCKGRMRYTELCNADSFFTML